MSAPSMLPKMSEEIPASSASDQQQPCKLTALERNNLEWESHKDEIRSIYMEQDKTLKDTMQYFEQEHNFSWSERKWKEKMQEWGFEKNIPAKEMKFMATKAWKRELEDEKETVFCRNGTVVDRGKVEMFKKQKLNSESSFVIQSIPGTPQNISYKTPKPISSDDCHSSLSEEDIEVQKAELQRLAATVGDDPIPKDDHFSAQIEPNSMLASPVGEIEVGSEEELSEESQYLEIPESSDLDDGHIMSGGPTPFEAISVPGPTECSSTKTISRIFHYEEEEFDTPGDLDYLRLEQLKGDMRSANQFLERGERSKAKTEYFKAVQTYINGGRQDDPTITTSVAEIIESFKSCTEVEVPTLALLWLDLLQCLMQNFLRRSATLLLYSHQGFLHELNTYPIILALNYLDVTRPVFSVLRVFLEGFAAPQGRRSISKRFRLLLLVFTCELKVLEYMRHGSSHWLKSTFSHLHDAALNLGLSGASSELELGLFGREAIHCLDRIIYGFSGDKNLFISSQSVEPFVTGLATRCSALGWFHEAEVLFIILRNVVKANHSLSLSATRISAQYCLHLEREKRYGEILSVLNDTYTDLSNIYDMDGNWERILSVPAEQDPHSAAIQPVHLFRQGKSTCGTGEYIRRRKSAF